MHTLTERSREWLRGAIDRLGYANVLGVLLEANWSDPHLRPEGESIHGITWNLGIAHRQTERWEDPSPVKMADRKRLLSIALRAPDAYGCTIRLIEDGLKTHVKLAKNPDQRRNYAFAIEHLDLAAQAAEQRHL